MGRRLAGWALLALATLMLLGFLRSSLGFSSPSAIVALLLTVVIPAVGGVSLLRGSHGPRGLSASQDALRRATIESEILKMAVAQQGRLTAVEVATMLALPVEETKAALDALVEREVAELDVSDAGVLVYRFHDAKHLESKRRPGEFLGG